MRNLLFDPNIPVEETVGAIGDLIKEGKVRYLRLSGTSVENICKAHRVNPVTALEIEYSLGTRVIESEILPAVRELGIGRVAYGGRDRTLKGAAARLSGALELRQIEHDVKEYPGAGHSFLDDYKGLIGVLGVVIGSSYKEKDAADARGRILGFFARHLA